MTLMNRCRSVELASAVLEVMWLRCINNAGHATFMRLARR